MTSFTKFIASGYPGIPKHTNFIPPYNVLRVNLKQGAREEHKYKGRYPKTNTEIPFLNFITPNGSEMELNKVIASPCALSSPPKDLGVNTAVACPTRHRGTFLGMNKVVVYLMLEFGKWLLQDCLVRFNKVFDLW